MRSVWKWVLAIPYPTTIDVPEGAAFLTAELQGECLCVWALVDPEASPVSRRLIVYGTGHEMPASTVPEDYIATFQLAGGSLVFHVFEDRS